MNFPISSHTVSIYNYQIHYLETGTPSAITLLFLHGASFQARTWQEIGILERIAGAGYHAIAVDLPGYGKSQAIRGYQQQFLLEFLEKLNLDKPIIISPSMSGSYSLPLVTCHSDRLRGFVAVAPVSIQQYQAELKDIPLPTLAIWGSNDSIVSVSNADLLVKLMPNARKIILPNAGHASYMRATNDFYQHLIDFVKVIEPD